MSIDERNIVDDFWRVHEVNGQPGEGASEVVLINLSYSKVTNHPIAVSGIAAASLSPHDFQSVTMKLLRNRLRLAAQKDPSQ